MSTAAGERIEGCTVAIRAWRRVEGTGPPAGDPVKEKTLTSIDVDQMAEAVADPSYIVWIDVVAPGPADLEKIGGAVGLGANSIEDVLAPHERPKVNRHGARQVFFMTYAVTGQDAALSRLSGFVLPTALITFRENQDLDLSEVTRRLDENTDLIVGPAALSYILLDVIVDGHFEAIQQLDDRIEELEDILFDEQATDRAFVKEVYGLRKQLVALRRVVLPMREVVNGLLRHHRDDESRSAHPELAERYDDLYDHVLRAAEWTESLRDMVTTVFETNLSLQDARLNLVMRKLAGWAAIIAVPTAITGWFGQNIPYPGFSNVFGLWQSAILVLVCSVGLYVLFKRKDWL